MKPTKKTKKESLKRFDVEVNFVREDNGSYGYGTVFKDSIIFSCKGNSKDRDKVVLSGLVKEIKRMISKNEDLGDISVTMNSLLESAQKSKTIESCEKKFQEQIIRQNWDDLLYWYTLRDGDDSLKIKEVLNDRGSWDDLYGCNFDIDEVDPDKEKIELEKADRDLSDREIENLKNFHIKLKKEEMKLINKACKLIDEAHESENHDELMEKMVVAHQQVHFIREVIKSYEKRRLFLGKWGQWGTSPKIYPDGCLR